MVSIHIRVNLLTVMQGNSDVLRVRAALNMQEQYRNAAADLICLAEALDDKPNVPPRVCVREAPPLPKQKTADPQLWPRVPGEARCSTGGGLDRSELEINEERTFRILNSLGRGPKTSGPLTDDLLAAATPPLPVESKPIVRVYSAAGPTPVIGTWEAKAPIFHDRDLQSSTGSCPAGSILTSDRSANTVAMAASSSSFGAEPTAGESGSMVTASVDCHSRASQSVVALDGGGDEAPGRLAPITDQSTSAGSLPPPSMQPPATPRLPPPAPQQQAPPTPQRSASPLPTGKSLPHQPSERLYAQVSAQTHPHAHPANPAHPAAVQHIGGAGVSNDDYGYAINNTDDYGEDDDEYFGYDY
jgi:hypothetical protein